MTEGSGMARGGLLAFLVVGMGGCGTEAAQGAQPGSADDDGVAIQMDVAQMQRKGGPWWVVPTGDGPFKDLIGPDGMSPLGPGLGTSSFGDNRVGSWRRFGSRGFAKGVLIYYNGPSNDEVVRISIRLPDARRRFSAAGCSGGQAFPQVDISPDGQTVTFTGGHVRKYLPNQRLVIWMRMPAGVSYEGLVETAAPPCPELVQPAPRCFDDGEFGPGWEPDDELCDDLSELDVEPPEFDSVLTLCWRPDPPPDPDPDQTDWEE
jgi:hypothetical protein